MTRRTSVLAVLLVAAVAVGLSDSAQAQAQGYREPTGQELPSGGVSETMRSVWLSHWNQFKGWLSRDCNDYGAIYGTPGGSGTFEAARDWCLMGQDEARKARENLARSPVTASGWGNDIAQRRQALEQQQKALEQRRQQLLDRQQQQAQALAQYNQQQQNAHDAQREQWNAYQQQAAAARQQQAQQQQALAEAQRMAEFQRQQLRNAEIANAVGDLATGVFSMFEKSPAERLAELQAERRAAEYRANRLADIGRRRAELANQLNAYTRTPPAVRTPASERLAVAQANYDLAAARAKVAELRAKAAEFRDALVDATSTPQVALGAAVMSGALAAATVTTAPVVATGALLFGTAALAHMVKGQLDDGLDQFREGMDRFFEGGRCSAGRSCGER